MLYQLLGSYWIAKAQGWVVLHLGDGYFLYPTGQIIGGMTKDVLNRMTPFPCS